jgi:hypothetical protein
MLVLAGIDLLGKFYAGDDAPRGVGNRFRGFIKGCFRGLNSNDEEVIYQLRNSLLHSFGLYSEANSKIYRFTLSYMNGANLVTHTPPDKYVVDIHVLTMAFEDAINAYGGELNQDVDLQNKFRNMYPKYGAYCLL